MLGRESEDLERDFGKRTAITTGALHIRRRNVLSLQMMVMMMMASAQLRVFSSNNIDICIINPRIPVVETGANGHATALPSTFSPLLCSHLASLTHPLCPCSTLYGRRELEGRVGIS